MPWTVARSLLACCSASAFALALDACACCWTAALLSDCACCWSACTAELNADWPAGVNVSVTSVPLLASTCKVSLPPDRVPYFAELRPEMSTLLPSIVTTIEDWLDNTCSSSAVLVSVSAVSVPVPVESH